MENKLDKIVIKLLIGLGIVVNFIFANPLFSPIPKMDIGNKAKYKLGKKLFFDPNLSLDKTVACVNCHIPELYGTDGQKVSTGVKGRKGKDNASTIYNTIYNIAQDWTGKTVTIKDKTKEAFLNKNEMAGDISKAISYIKSNENLHKDFIKIYGKVDEESLFGAISYYVSHLTTPDSKFDKFLKGDSLALNENEKRGYRLFKEYGCVSCHNGINIGGNMYQKIGIFNMKGIKRDNNLGRYKVTHKKEDRYVYMVPSLRNVSKTAPYFHNGSLNTLEEVIEFMAKHQLDIEIPKEDIKDIELFLKTLTGNIPNE